MLATHGVTITIATKQCGGTHSGNFDGVVLFNLEHNMKQWSLRYFPFCCLFDDMMDRRSR